MDVSLDTPDGLELEMTAVVITLSLIVILFMTLADLVVGWLDPRVRLAAANR